MFSFKQSHPKLQYTIQSAVPWCTSLSQALVVFHIHNQHVQQACEVSFISFSSKAPDDDLLTQMCFPVSELRTRDIRVQRIRTKGDSVQLAFSVKSCLTRIGACHPSQAPWVSPYFMPLSAIALQMSFISENLKLIT